MVSGPEWGYSGKVPLRKEAQPVIPYAPPIQDMRFALDTMVGLDRITALPGYEDANAELVDAVLEEAGKLASEVIAPTNMDGDAVGAVFENGVVRTPDSFKPAYAQYRDGGWNALPFDPEFGGQGLPWSVAMPVQEMWQAANMAFGLCPLLNQGCVELLQAHGTEDQKQTYLPKLITGDWTGTMNLTEPQAGSDLAALHCRAEPDGDAYRIRGQKVFITYGEHDLAENIIHMVLARLPDAPEGSRGISLFLVPKFLPNPDGSPGRRNDLRCVSIEHKLGIHASPTCVMAFGDTDGAIGWLVGAENRGLNAMFTMMNNARLSVGLQGVAIGDRAYQQARDFARDRVQSRDLEGSDGPVTIVHHPDVRRMLLTMRGTVEAGRALAYHAGGALDIAKRAPDAQARAAAQARVDLLTPVVKAWCTDAGVDVASLGIQVHGGMGYVEETGAAQHMRDARICPIYEGTNGIQAADLAFRKVKRDGGAAMRTLIAEMTETAAAADAGGADLAVLGHALSQAAQALAQATDDLVAASTGDTAAVATPYLALAGTVAGGWALTRQAVEAQARLSGANGDAGFLTAKLATARVYADGVLPQAGGLAACVKAGAGPLMAVPEDAL